MTYMCIWIVLIDIDNGDYDNNNSNSNLPHSSVTVLILLLIFFIKTNRTISTCSNGPLLVALHTLLNCPEGRLGVSDVQPISRISGCRLHPFFYLFFFLPIPVALPLLSYILLLTHSPDLFSPKKYPVFFSS